MSSTELITTSDGSRAAVDAAEARVTARARSAVRPIYVNEGQDPVHHASCTFISVDGQDYLVTCAHVVDAHEHHTLFVGQGELRPITLTFGTTVAPSGDRDLDNIDFAFAAVGPDWRGAGIEPMAEDEMERPDALLYCAYGFPNSRNKKINHPGRSITPTAQPFISNRVDDAAVFEAAGISAQHHLALFRDPKAAFDGGKKVTPFEPVGMSGGAIFAMHGLSRPEVLAGLEQPTISCVAIVTHKNKEHKLLYGTKVSSIVSAIRAYR